MTEFENELLKIPKTVLFQMTRNLFDCLEDGKYTMTGGFISRDDLSSFESFSKIIDKLKKKKMISRQDHLKMKRAATGTKKPKINSTLEIEDEKKKKKKAIEDLNESRKYYDSSLPHFEVCLTLFGERSRVDYKGIVANERLVIFFSQDPYIGKPALDDLQEHLKSLSAITRKEVFETKEMKETKEVTNIMLISSHKLTPTAASTTIPLMRKKYNIQVFQHENLMLNVTKHWLTKKHVRISLKEREKLKEKYRLTEETIYNLPRILIDDPFSLWYDFRIGEIIRIGNPGMGYNYRIVTELPQT
jgi:DNA-directed RNA polymerase subunit H (RpoH/RPB5)